MFKLFYGAFDDCIEVEGVIEAEYQSDEGGYLAFSDGTLLSVACIGLGKWIINRLVEGNAKYIKEDTVIYTATHAYDTDKVTLIGGNIQWVVFGIYMKYRVVGKGGVE